MHLCWLYENWHQLLIYFAIQRLAIALLNGQLPHYLSYKLIAKNNKNNLHHCIFVSNHLNNYSIPSCKFTVHFSIRFLEQVRKGLITSVQINGFNMHVKGSVNMKQAETFGKIPLVPCKMTTLSNFPLFCKSLLISHHFTVFHCHISPCHLIAMSSYISCWHVVNMSNILWCVGNITGILQMFCTYHQTGT